MARVIIASCQQVSISGTNAKSNALPTCGEIWAYSTTDCFLTIAPDPVATASGNGNAFIQAGVYVPLTVPNGTQKVGAITSGASGLLYILPLG